MILLPLSLLKWSCCTQNNFQSEPFCTHGFSNEREILLRDAEKAIERQRLGCGDLPSVMIPDLHISKTNIVITLRRLSSPYSAWYRDCYWQYFTHLEMILKAQLVNCGWIWAHRLWGFSFFLHGTVFNTNFSRLILYRDVWLGRGVLSRDQV